MVTCPASASACKVAGLAVPNFNRTKHRGNLLTLKGSRRGMQMQHHQQCCIAYHSAAGSGLHLHRLCLQESRCPYQWMQRVGLLVLFSADMSSRSSAFLRSLGRRRTEEEGQRRLHDLKQSLGGSVLFHCPMLQPAANLVWKRRVGLLPVAGVDIPMNAITNHSRGASPAASAATGNGRSADSNIAQVGEAGHGRRASLSGSTSAA